jgi:hypothetical protein
LRRTAAIEVEVSMWWLVMAAGSSALTRPPGCGGLSFSWRAPGVGSGANYAIRPGIRDDEARRRLAARPREHEEKPSPMIRGDGGHALVLSSRPETNSGRKNHAHP